MRRWFGVSCIFLLAAGAAQAEPAVVTQRATTKHYKLELQVGPPERMYTASEARAAHPASGEIMVGGRMPEMMHDTAEMRHLELHIYSRANGRTIGEAHVAILVSGGDRRGLSVPIARMYGVSEGPEDLHYGNNVMLPAGSYTIEAVVNGERARFPVTVPGSS